jgi:hypothetical protein
LGPTVWSEEAYQLDPLNQNLVGILAGSLTARGETEKALGLRRTQIDHEWQDFSQGITRLENGDFEEVRQLLADFPMPFGVLPARYTDLAIAAVAAPECRPVSDSAFECS